MALASGVNASRRSFAVTLTRAFGVSMSNRHKPWLIFLMDCVEGYGPSSEVYLRGASALQFGRHILNLKEGTCLFFLLFLHQAHVVFLFHNTRGLHRHGQYDSSLCILRNWGKENTHDVFSVTPWTFCSSYHRFYSLVPCPKRFPRGKSSSQQPVCFSQVMFAWFIKQ